MNQQRAVKPSNLQTGRNRMTEVTGAATTSHLPTSPKFYNRQAGGGFYNCQAGGGNAHWVGYQERRVLHLQDPHRTPSGQ